MQYIIQVSYSYRDRDTKREKLETTTMFGISTNYVTAAMMLQWAVSTEYITISTISNNPVSVVKESLFTGILHSGYDKNVIAHDS